MSDWREVVKVVAPWIGAVATGGVPALVGVAAAQVSSAFGMDVEATTNGIAAAISGATPEQLNSLKKAELDFQVQMKGLGFSNIQALEALAVTDRDSARKRNIEMKDHTPAILAYIVVFSFAAVLVGLFFLDLKVPDSLRDVSMMLLGTLAVSYTQVLNYFLGASSSNVARDKVFNSVASNNNKKV